MYTRQEMYTAQRPTTKGRHFSSIYTHPSHVHSTGDLHPSETKQSKEGTSLLCPRPAIPCTPDRRCTPLRDHRPQTDTSPCCPHTHPMYNRQEMYTPERPQSTDRHISSLSTYPSHVHTTGDVHPERLQTTDRHISSLPTPLPRVPVARCPCQQL